MSYSWRERLRIRIGAIIIKYNLDPDDLDWVEENIEDLCKEADIRCKAIDPNKIVDQVILELDNEAFDKFSKGVIDEVKARIDRNKKRQKYFKNDTTEQEIPLVYPNNSTPFERPQRD